jgi:hypothetical protein
MLNCNFSEFFSSLTLQLLVKMTALWQNFERRQEAQPTAPALEVQARLSRLEKEVVTLKAFIHS